jgi:hypothetical protein
VIPLLGRGAPGELPSVGGPSAAGAGGGAAFAPRRFARTGGGAASGRAWTLLAGIDAVEGAGAADFASPPGRAAIAADLRAFAAARAAVQAGHRTRSDVTSIIRSTGSSNDLPQFSQVSMG